MDIRSLAPNIELFDFTEINKIPALAPGLVSLADLNSNGSPEIAVLLMDMVTGDSVVTIRDGMSASLISTFNFGAVWIESLLAIVDISGICAP